MENLEPKKERSPIESLKFQRKSDYKKFRNFIKKETKELKDITEPKEDKLKSILKVGAGGLGFLAIGGLIGAKSRVGKDDGVIPKFGPFAIGRRNLPQSEIQLSPNTLKAPRTGKVGKVLRGTRTSGAITIPRSRMTTSMIKVTQSQTEQFAERTREAESRQLVEKKKNRNISKKLTRQLTVAERDSIKRERNTKRITQTIEKGDRPQSRYSDYGSRKRFLKPKTSFPKTNVKFYGKMGFQKFFGGTRIGEVRPKTGFKIDPLSGNIVPIDPIEAIIREAETDPNVRRQFLKDSAPERIMNAIDEAEAADTPSTRFSKMRRGTRTFSPLDPTKVDPQRITGTLGKNRFKPKGGVAKFIRKLLRRPNPKMTKDSFLGITYKGKFGSVLGAASSNPLVKAGFFILDAYAAYTSGKQVFNLRDNLGTALYDLYVSINNEIFKDNPENLKYYISESSDKNMSIKQRRRNEKISEIKGKFFEKVYGGRIVSTTSDGSANSDNRTIMIIPDNKQKNEVKSTAPIKNGGNEISFVPFEPVNSVGTDILLHKLNQ